MQLQCSSSPLNLSLMSFPKVSSIICSNELSAKIIISSNNTNFWWIDFQTDFLDKKINMKLSEEFFLNFKNVQRVPLLFCNSCRGRGYRPYRLRYRHDFRDLSPFWTLLLNEGPKIFPPPPQKRGGGHAPFVALYSENWHFSNYYTIWDIDMIFGI